MLKPVLRASKYGCLFLIWTVTVVEGGSQALEALQREQPGTFQLVLTVGAAEWTFVVPNPSFCDPCTMGQIHLIELAGTVR